MSRNGTLLPIPAMIPSPFAQLIADWPDSWLGVAYPRSVWLRDFEDLLREFYPQSSSADRRLTARSVAPFPLRDGPNVP